MMTGTHAWKVAGGAGLAVGLAISGLVLLPQAPAEPRVRVIELDATLRPWTVAPANVTEPGGLAPTIAAVVRAVDVAMRLAPDSRSVAGTTDDEQTNPTRVKVVAPRVVSERRHAAEDATDRARDAAEDATDRARDAAGEAGDDAGDPEEAGDDAGDDEEAGNDAGDDEEAGD